MRATPHFTRRLDELADDIGRLRRRYPDEYLVERIGEHVGSLYLLTTPSAAELALEMFPGCEKTIVAAIDVTDANWRKLQHRLGKKAA